MSLKKLFKILLTISILLISFSLFGEDNDFSRRVYVGVYQNKPKIFLDENGVPSGFFIDLLEQIAKEENWELKYISGSWSECLQNLVENKIDLMPDVAYSEERDELFDFHSIPVLESWSRIYSSKESGIEDLTDLEGKKVAILDESIQEDVFNQLMEGFGYEVEIIPVSSLTEAFEYARDGVVDAAIANHLFGEYYYLNYELEKTTIDFNPAKLYYAAAERKNAEILGVIDRYLEKWKGQDDSPYYSTLGKWEAEERFLLPPYIVWIFGGLAGLIMLTIGIIILLRHQVNVKTGHLKETVQMKNRALTELQKSERKYRLITEHVSDVIWILDLNLKFTYVSPSIEKMLGYKPEEFTNLSLDEIIEPDSLKNLIKVFKEEIDNKELNESDPDRSRVIETEQVRKNGSKIFVESRMAFLQDKSGKINGILGISRDVTKRKLAEKKMREHTDELEEMVRERTEELTKMNEKLRESNKRLKELDRLKSVFLANMSHELRTPLNSIIGFTGIILQGISGDINDEQRKQLKMVKNSANHLLNLVNDVLDFSKIEAGRVELSVEHFKLSDVVKEVTETSSFLANKKGIELITEVSEEISLKSDRRRVKQILMNLVGNAIKFTDLGSVKIVARQKNENYIDIEVIDTGMGIREEDIEKLFQPFQQIDMSRTKKHEGTGLGLHLSRKIALILGGDIAVESEFGEGSKFVITLPLEYQEKENKTEPQSKNETEEGKQNG